MRSHRQRPRPFYRPQTKFGARWDFCTCLCHSVHMGGGGRVVSQHALQVVSQHALQQVSRGGWYPSMPCRFPDRHPGEKLRGTWLGGCLQAHTQGGSWGGSGQGGLQAHTWGGLSQHALRQTLSPATAMGGTHPTGMHSFYWDIIVRWYSYCTETYSQYRLPLGSVLFYQYRSLFWV